LPHVRLLASDKLSLLAGTLLFGNVRGERLQWLSTSTSTLVMAMATSPIKWDSECLCDENALLADGQAVTGDKQPAFAKALAFIMQIF